MRDDRKDRYLRRLAVVTTFGMFLVLIMGATVTTTGSGEGCGQSWPLCHGKFIPEFAIATLIEYSHRAVTGVEGILIAALSVGTWLRWRQRREVQILVPAMVFFLLLQAGLGAWAVLYPQSTAVLALHFGISLTALASVLLTTVFLYEVNGAEAVRDRLLPPRLREFAFGVLTYIYLVVYLGAYVRHAHASLACGDWPLCQGRLIPDLDGPVGVMFLHRLAALGGILVIAALVAWTHRHRASRPDLYRGSVLSLVLILALAISGGVVVLSRLNLFSALTHAGLVSLLFGSLSYVCYHALPRSRDTVVSTPSAEAGPVNMGQPAAER